MSLSRIARSYVIGNELRLSALRGRSPLAGRENSTFAVSQRPFPLAFPVPSSISLGAPSLILVAHNEAAVERVNPVLLVSQHGRAFVFVVIFLQQLPVDGVVVRRGDPFVGNHAWKRDPDAGGSIEPGRRGTVGQFFAEIGGEMIAVAAK